MSAEEVIKERVYKGDTAILEAFLYGEDGVTPVTADTLNWQIKKPDGTIDTGGPLTISNSEASIAYNGTTDPGLYTAQITFTLPNSNKKSVLNTFEVVDPMQVTETSTTPEEKALDRAWMKLEDLFDSDLGGPWLRDKSKQIFDRDKMLRMVPDALYTIGSTYQPVVLYDETNFPYTQHTPLLAQAILVEAIYYMMRAYVEQPVRVTGGPVSYFDRRDYLNRWQIILQQEEKKLNGYIDLFKKEQMGYGSTATLLGGYSNVYGRSPRYMRGRYPYTQIRW